MLSSSISSTCPHNMVNFGPLVAEIVSLVWGTSAIMAALCNRAGRYIFALWFLSFYRSIYLFYSSPNLSGRRLDVYHTSARGVAQCEFIMHVWSVPLAARWKYRTQKWCKVWLTPTTRVPCSNAAKTQNPLKLAGVPKLANRRQVLVGRSSPYCGDMWRTYCCLTFFPIVDTCLSCEDIARQSCAMVPRWRFLATFCVLCLQRAVFSRFQTGILNSH